MKMRIAWIGMVGLISSQGVAKMVEKKVSHKLGGTQFESILVFGDAISSPRHLVLMVPNFILWLQREPL